MPGSAEVQRATIDKFIDGWKTKDPQAWISNWTDDCTNTILPFSMKHPGWSKTEVSEVQLPKLFGNLFNWELDVHEIVHDVPNSKCVVYGISRADTPYDDGKFKWTNEYSAFIYLTDDGTQIRKIEEMVDTAFFAEMAKQGMAHRAKLAEKAKAEAEAQGGANKQETPSSVQVGA